jgi:hypothetical protein
MPWFCFTLIILVIELWLFPIWLFWKKLHIGKPMHKWHDATKPKDSSYFWFLSYILKKFNYRNYLSKNIFQHWKETKNCRFFSNFCCMIYLVIYIFFANAPGLDTWINLAWLWPYFRPELDGWDKIRTYHLSIVSLVCYPLSTIFVHFQLCDRTAFSESGYRYHLLTSHPEPNRQKPFECPSCDKSFVQQKLLRKHLASRHSDDSDARRHVCPFCPASFKRKDHVTRHVTDTHSLVTKLFDCSTCDAKFQSASHLRQHERLHEDRGGFYECPVCKERIVRKKGFKRHLDLHKKAATDEVSTSGCFPSLTGLNSQNSGLAFDQQTLTRQFFWINCEEKTKSDFKVEKKI